MDTVIIDHGNRFYREKLSADKQQLTMNDLPIMLEIYDADINIHFSFEKAGIRSSLSRSLLLQELIANNTNDNTGFIVWISNYFEVVFLIKR